MVNQCIQWIESQNKPWIAHLSLFRPHTPFVAPEPYNEQYSPDTVDPCRKLSTLEQEAAQHPWLATNYGNINSAHPGIKIKFSA